ncbi:MAG: hypothetical protein KC940_21755, partial [Candidatus Omnitrophica bacterium]|nr:hypothetical protein [Candidatus Omnitrophota bacterium]
GAIWSSGDFDFEGPAVVSNNTAGSDGGGIYSIGLNLAFWESTLSGNRAGRSGGGIWSGSQNLSINQATITGNTASGDEADEGGGGVFIEIGSANLMGESEIANNSADGILGSGGGVLLLHGDLTVSASCVIDNNSANRSGGGVEIVDGMATFNQTYIRDNDVDGKAGIPNPGNGGGVHISGDFLTATFNDCVVENNVAASEGGGLWNQTNTVLNFNGGRIVSNTSNSGGGTINDGGGGVFNNGGVVLVSAGLSPTTIMGNRALEDNGSGGGILSVGGGVGLTDAIVLGNQAVAKGGGILTIGGGMSSEQCIFEGNVAGDGGGAVEVYNAEATIRNNTFAIGTNTPSELAIDLTPSDDNAMINSSTVEFGSKRVLYDGTVNTLTILGLNGNDQFEVAPSPDTSILIQGDSPVVGNPGVPPGDGLNLDLTGLTKTSYTQGSSAGNGTFSFGGDAMPVSFMSIESATVPGVYDFGDAPDSYQTLAASNGPRHGFNPLGPILGSHTDYEADGQPTTNADGDNLTGDVDDEDGVAIPFAIVTGATATFDVFTALGGVVEFYFDFDQDGIFENTPEESFVFDHPQGGALAASIPIPPTALPGSTFFRVRVSSSGVGSPIGSAVDGEVEDYPVTLIQGSVPTIDCPEDMVVDNDLGACGRTLTLNIPTTGVPTPTMECAIDGIPILSFYTFSVGTTTVDCTATNDLGSATCSFTVTVNDVEIPSATCLSPIVALDELGSAT